MVAAMRYAAFRTFAATLLLAATSHAIKPAQVDDAAPGSHSGITETLDPCGAKQAGHRTKRDLGGVGFAIV